MPAAGSDLVSAVSPLGALATKDAGISSQCAVLFSQCADGTGWVRAGMAGVCQSALHLFLCVLLLADMSKETTWLTARSADTQTPTLRTHMVLVGMTVDTTRAGCVHLTTMPT